MLWLLAVISAACVGICVVTIKALNLREDDEGRGAQDEEKTDKPNRSVSSVFIDRAHRRESENSPPPYSSIA